MMRKGKVVVVGDDFSLMGDDAILEALQLLDAGVAHELHVVHVHDLGEEAAVSDVSTCERERKMLAGTPDSMARRVHYLAEMSSLAHDPTKIVTHARLGKPVQILLETAVDLDADLVIVGTQGRSGVARWLLGSVAETLVRKAGCPVLVARPKRHRGTEWTALPKPPHVNGRSTHEGRAASSRVPDEVAVDAVGKV